MIMLHELSQIDYDTFAYIGQRCYDTTVGPTIREIGTTIERSVAVTKKHVDRLVGLGLLRRVGNTNRAVLLFTDEGAKLWKREHL